MDWSCKRKIVIVFKLQVYGYARKFAKIGIAGALVGSLQVKLSSPSLVSASTALRALSVNVSEVKRSNGY